MSRKQWKAGVIVALSLMFVAWSFWPVQAGSSTRGNRGDKLSENFDFVTSPDDAAVDITDVLMTGFVFDDASPDTVDEGDSGYARMSADRRIYVDADVTGPAGAGAFALDTSVDTLETLLAKGTGVMTASHSTTLATDDTQFGAVGAATDPDGNVHGQLRSIAESVASPPTNEAVAGTGALLDADASASKDTTSDDTYTTTAGKVYKVTAIDGVVYMGVADVGAAGVTAAAVIWTITAGTTEHVRIPTAITTLHYSASAEDVSVRISEVLDD